MTLNTQKDITWINDCDCIVDESLLSRAILWFADHNVQAVKHIFLHGNYAGVSACGKKIHVHRLLMMYKYKKKLGSDIVVHHKNENKLDDRMANLEILTVKTHAHIHNHNKTLSEAHKAKIAEAGHRRKGMSIKKRINIPVDKLKTDLANGMSINAIANKYHCDWTTVKSKINQNPELLEGRK